MGTEQIMYYIIALILGMLLANMLKSVCGCKTVEGSPYQVGQFTYKVGAPPCHNQTPQSLGRDCDRNADTNYTDY